MADYFESGLLVGEPAWHSMGNVIPVDDARRFDVAASIELAGMDWRVDLQDLWLRNPEWKEGMSTASKAIKVETHQATMRSSDSKILGVVGSRYTPCQNIEAFSWFQPWLDTREVAIESAGSLKGGSVVWVLGKILREEIQVGQGDNVEKYLLFTTSHDGSKRTSVGFCPTRVVCWNTLSIGLQQGRMLRTKHTKNQQTALQEIRKTIDLIDKQFNATGEQYQKLLRCGVSEKDLRNYVKMVLEVDIETKEKDLSTRCVNTIDQIVTMAVGGMGNDGRTAWSAYNGVTQYLSHNYGHNAENRLDSLWLGKSNKTNERALSLALQLAS